MKILFFEFILFPFFCGISCKGRSFSLVADINVQGVVGSILFTQDDKLYPVSIRTELQPSSNNMKFGWQIHQMPILWDYSDEDYCKVAVINSPMLHNLTARHGLIYDRALYNDEMISINSFKESISGHTLVLVDSNNKAVSCSTILPLSPKQIGMVADFSTNVSGNIYFLSYFDSIFKKTILIGSLYKNDKILNGDGFDWYIGEKEFQPDDMECSSSINDDQIFNPTNEAVNSSSCNSYDTTGCIIGDMTAKHGKIFPGEALDWSKVRPFSLKDSNLPLDGINSITWHAVYLVDKFNQEIVSCAVIKPIDEVKYKVLLKIPDLNENKVFGIVYFRQFSPYHSTYTKIRVKENDDFKMELKYPPVFALYDLFPNGLDCNAIGNILTDKEGKVRLLVSSDIYSDYNNESVHEGVVEIGFITGFTLFGRKSILGQTVAVFKEFPRDTTPACCGQILPIKAEETIALIANFSSSQNITGYIFLTQYLYNKEHMQYSDTFIVAEVYNRNGYITKDHKYHIHQYPVQEDDQGVDPTLYCLSTGPHYNPYMVNVSQPNYDQECKIDYMKRCEVGDLNGKHGLLDVGRRIIQFIDTNLNLYGPETSLGRSIVIHGEGKQKTAIACAKIEQFSR